MDALSLGLSCCPSDNADKFELIKELNLFVRRLAWKAIFNTKFFTDSEQSFSFFQQISTRKVDFCAICYLVELLHENEDFDENIEFNGGSLQYPGERTSSS